MAAWRRKALEHFPELRGVLNDRRCTIHGLFMDLLPMVRDAHAVADTERLRRIYDFAAWCFRQQSGEPSNAAGVTFYEHLLDRRGNWAVVLPWLDEAVIAGCRATSCAIYER